MRRLTAVLLIACLTESIAFGQKKQKSVRPPAAIPTGYRDVDNTLTPPDPQTLADAKWFEVFKDEKLQELIREALGHNYDLRETVARVAAAEAELGLTRSEQFPTITGSSDITVQRTSRD